MTSLIQVEDPTVPASIAGALLPGAVMQGWLDTNSAIGGACIDGRVIDQADSTVSPEGE